MAKRRVIILPGELPTILVTKVANQSIPNVTVTKVTFDTVVFNNFGFQFNTATNDITITQSGIYEVSYNTQWGAGVVGNRSVQFFIGGVVSFSDAHPVATIAAALPHKFSSTHVLLTTGQVIDMRVYHNQGAALNLLATANRTPMMALSLLVSI